MVLDKNAYCLGGTGKKIKHCACQDITGELDKIVTSIQGDQRVAALNRINHTLATKANRPCLLALKIRVLLQMNDLQALEDTVTTFLKVAPENLLAHTFAAQLELRKNRLRVAIDEVQTAWSLAGESVPYELVDTCASLAQALLNHGDYLAAHAHMIISLTLDPKNEEFHGFLADMLGAGHIPPILKRNPAFADCPAGATWKGRFDAAYRACVTSSWKNGLEKFERLNQDFPDQPAILYNIALARSCLGLPRQPEAWHAYARCPGVEYSQAVEAEAIAQLLALDADTPSVTLVKWTINIQDANALNERLLSCKRAVPLTKDLSAFRTGDEPPPKSVFTLLDQPKPAADAPMTADNLARVLTNLALFGRQTDRPARVEMVVPKTEVAEQVRSLLVEVAGELLTSEESEEIVDTVPQVLSLINLVCIAPEEAPYPARRRAMAELTQRIMARHWPDIPLASLDGKTPRQVQADPAYRVPLAGALVALDQLAETGNWLIDVDALREQLGVPIPEPIELGPEALYQLSPADLARVRTEHLTDDLLLELFELTTVYHLRRAMARFGEEILRRESLIDKVNRAAVYKRVAELAPFSDQALDYIREAQQIAVADKDSPARYLIAELTLRLVRRELEEASKVLQKVQKRHLHEPGVADTLLRVLHRFGVLRSDDLAGEASPAQPEPAAATSRIWTPDSQAAAADRGKPSGLWRPD